MGHKIYLGISKQKYLIKIANDFILKKGTEFFFVEKT